MVRNTANVGPNLAESILSNTVVTPPRQALSRTKHRRKKQKRKKFRKLHEASNLNSAVDGNNGVKEDDVFDSVEDYDWFKKWSGMSTADEFIAPKDTFYLDRPQDDLTRASYYDYLERNRSLACDEYEICKDQASAAIDLGNTTEFLVQFLPVFPEKPMPYYKSVYVERAKDSSKVGEGADSLTLEDTEPAESQVQYASPTLALPTRAKRKRHRRRKKWPRVASARPLLADTFRKRPRGVRNKRKPVYLVEEPEEVYFRRIPAYRHPSPPPVEYYAERRQGVTGAAALSPGVLFALPLVLLSGLAIGFYIPLITNGTVLGGGGSGGSSSGQIDLLTELNIAGVNVTNTIMTTNMNMATNTNDDADTIMNMAGRKRRKKRFVAENYLAPGANLGGWLPYAKSVSLAVLDVLGEKPETFFRDYGRSIFTASASDVYEVLRMLARKMSCAREKFGRQGAGQCAELLICDQFSDDNMIYESNLFVKSGEIFAASLYKMATADGKVEGSDPVEEALDAIASIMDVAVRDECQETYKECKLSEVEECLRVY